jgi:hypothetical protein
MGISEGMYVFRRSSCSLWRFLASKKRLPVLEHLRQSQVLAGGRGGGQRVAYHRGSGHVVWNLVGHYSGRNPRTPPFLRRDRRKTTN